MLWYLKVSFTHVIFFFYVRDNDSYSIIMKGHLRV